MMTCLFWLFASLFVGLLVLVLSWSVHRQSPWWQRVCLLAAVVLVFFVVGCAGLDALYPGQRERPMSQIGMAVRDLANNEQVRAVADMVPGGPLALALMSGAGTAAFAFDQWRKHREDHQWRADREEADRQRALRRRGKNSDAHAAIV